MITDEQINEFIENGVVVIENVLNHEEINYYRKCFHDEISKLSYDYEDIIINNNTEGIKFNEIKSKLNKSFYYKWKMELQSDKRIYDIFHKLLYNCANFYGFKVNENFKIYPFIDRIGFRLPDSIHKDGGLNLHVDKIGKKFRPIQAFISLTDQLGSNHGGLQLVKKFHISSNLTHEQIKSLNLKDNHELISKLNNINLKAGSLVLWDFRLPHKTNKNFISDDTREVIYLSYLPDTKLNYQYAKDQWNNYCNNTIPPDFINYKFTDNKTLNLITDYDKNLSYRSKKIFNPNLK